MSEVFGRKFEEGDRVRRDSGMEDRPEGEVVGFQAWLVIVDWDLPISQTSELEGNLELIE